MPFASITTWVGKASISFPRRKVIMDEKDQLSDASVALYSFGRNETVASVSLSVGEGEGQRVRRISLRGFRQAKKPLHHFGHGNFLRRAVPDDGLLYFSRGQLVNFQASLREGRHRCASGFAHDQSCLQILGIEQSLDDAQTWPVLFEH